MCGLKCMSKQDQIELIGIVKESRRGTLFVVEVTVGDKKHEVLAHLSGKIRQNLITILIGDKVKVEVSPYDLGKGRITRRL